MARRRGEVAAALRAVTFDMDDTLRQILPFPPPLRFAELCAAAGIRLSPEQAEAGARARKRFVEQSKTDGSLGQAGWALRYARAGLEAAGVAGDLDALAAAVVAARRLHPAPSGPDPDLAELLPSLRERGLVLGVVSNNGAGLAEGVAALGVAEHFHAIVDAETAGAFKPDPAIYRAAAAALGVAPAQCLHVGDSPHDDVGVAKAAGASAVLYDPLEALEADCPRIRRLRDLLALL